MDWQDYAALALVAGAVLYLLCGLVKKRSPNAPSSPCGSSCGGCPAPTEPHVVSLSPTVKPK